MANFFDNKARAAAAASSSKPKPTESVTLAPALVPWVEKYRPKSLDDVKSQEHATETLRRMVHAANLPHLLLFGPPGTGKTSTILALCRELFGPELMKTRVKEMNASDERGLTVIREKVKQFASQHLVSAPVSAEYREKYPCPPFKVVILDEADALTTDAQSALRRIIENYSKTTRFCLIANFVSRIIAPIASRCSKFRFKSLEGPQASARIQDILNAEHVEYEDGVVERSLQVSDGDLRRAITLLQSAARLAGAVNSNSSSDGRKPIKKQQRVAEDSDDEMEDVDADTSAAAGPTKSSKIRIADINEIAGLFPPDSTDKLITVLKKGSTTNYKRIAAEVNDITASGYAANEVLSSLYSKIIFDDLVDTKKKYKLSQIFSEFDKRLVDGVDEQLAMLDMSCQIAGVLAT
ncbi:Subunit of heteropentameric Replication factor C (RF-C) [Exophiala dermatitidis]|uniref:Replication factor C subunit 2/4 n=2 Tax=Exophiala dermatitidis TaxID=5970 RepID=H6BSV5_EXODN|nr:replication factor C subunit 2/4 [Exophiala dermatitidis NIH/UT8656]KAJ4505851.1 Subunit of heteropentameric Replication factor C (RF-C) [Exophiala dermatitidis]EHY54259.1 replication factor C subunit 2/4 [Exophiala dermatitidis NIH/UT8656]KAJ4507996.1 Subunit of heteropentameric Replication factor C (RF-C) [Exophiala dermatitidis]KAJ4513595.1 Subunit of heteropentameric Replication factor C (RF-C) [Exophiala dermatitidis]KAJ4535562.1 Subunit of heteropentameric Replication factor C (RF-C) 